MEKTKIKCISDSVFYLQNKAWTCGTEYKDKLQLAMVCEIVDMADVDDAYEDYKYPYFLEVNIVPHYSEYTTQFINRAKKCVGVEDEKLVGLMIADVAYLYSGGIPVNIIGFSNKEFDELNKKSNVSTGAYCFESPEDARDFILHMLPLITPAIFGLIGYQLDKKLNLIGKDGWDTIRQQTKGE